MNTDLFEGYIGIRSGEGHLVDDALFVVILVLLCLFAFIFRLNYPLVKSKLKSFLSFRERQNVFEVTMRENFFFKIFMRFQTLFLLALFSFLCLRRSQNIEGETLTTASLMLGGCFLITLGFYFIKQGFYIAWGRVFCPVSGYYRLWFNNYNIMLYIWGIILYIPTLSLLFEPAYFQEILFFFVVAYVLFRILLVFVTIRIFYDKKTGFFFLSSYLCAEEIIPLLLLYKGLDALQNIINTSTLWL